MTERSKIFVSYSHRDTAWLKRLQVHLKPLVRSGVIDLWDDTRIKSGELWQKEIQDALDQTFAAILLISADFMASDFIHDEEIPPLLLAAEQQGIVILPVIISPSNFTEVPALSRFQAVNPPSEPLIGMVKADSEALFVLLARTVQGLAQPAPEPDQPALDPQTDATPFASQPPRQTVAANARLTISELQERMNATRQLLANFAPERYTYLALVGVSVIVCLASAGKLIFEGDLAVSQQVMMMSLSLGSGGASTFFCSQLLKLRARAFEFMREISANTRGMA